MFRFVVGIFLLVVAAVAFIAKAVLNGKVKRAHAYKSHLLNGHGKTTKLKRGLRKGAYADVTNVAAIKRMIPYK